MFNISCQSDWGVSAAWRWHLIPAKPATSHRGPIFIGFKNCSGLQKTNTGACAKKSSEIRILVFTRIVNFQVSPCILNMMKTGKRILTGTLNLTSLDFRAVVNPNIYTHRSDCLIGLSLSYYTHTRGELIYWLRHVYFNRCRYTPPAPTTPFSACEYCIFFLLSEQTVKTDVSTFNTPGTLYFLCNKDGSYLFRLWRHVTFGSLSERLHQFGSGESVNMQD